MYEAADKADVDPDRLSFIRSLQLVRRQIADQVGFPLNTQSGARDRIGGNPSHHHSRPTPPNMPMSGQKGTSPVPHD